MVEHRPRMSGVSGLLMAGSTPFLFVIFFFLIQNYPVLATENPIEVESREVSARAVNGRSVYGLDQISGVTGIDPFQQPIEENGALSANAIPPEMEVIEGQYQLQLMQREVMELRGLVEELTFQLNRMRATQEDRYLELDRRFQLLSQERASTTEGTNARKGAIEANSGSEKTQPVTQDEKALYEMSLKLIRNRQYDLAITQLLALIAAYPDGIYAPNAYYWLGEVYAAKPDPDYEKARQALAQVISFFPDHRKVPDAAFKLGKVYHLMGDCARATDILSQVVEEHRGKSVARLAESYLRDKVSCDGQ